MDLGKAKLLRTGLNALHQAVHPVHGIAWTDGKQVCLTSISHVDGEVKFGDANVIGQFEHVFGLFWGPSPGAGGTVGSPALLAVQHKKHVTVWQLQLSALEQNKLLCTQTCEVSEPLPLLPQGCVWHPKLDALAVLTKRDASVLFSVRADNRRVKAEVRVSGSIRCACWTKDGARLVVAVGSALHSFVWSDAHKSLLPCSFCPAFDVGGYVCAVEPTGESQVAVATELPLDKLCDLSAGGWFEPPARDAPSPSLSDEAGAGRRFPETACSSPASPGPVDLTQLLARHRRSDPSPLLHLQRRDTLTGSGQDSSHLILVTYERKVTTSRKVCIPGILVPDIVAFDPRGSTVAVASNACSMVLVYCVASSSAVPNVQQISLEKDERPKGACFLSDKLLLLMVGRQKSSGDAAFLPSSSTSSSNTDKYVLRIVVKDLMCGSGGDPAPPSPSPSAFLPRPESPARLHHQGIRKHSEHTAWEETRNLVLPGGAPVGGLRSPGGICGGGRRKLVEEVTVERSREPSPVTSQADFSSTSSCSSITAENFDTGPRPGHRTPAFSGPASPNSGRAGCPSPRLSASEKLPLSEVKAPRPRPPPVSDKGPAAAAVRERGPERLVENMERLFTRLADMQQCVVDIKDLAPNGKKAATATSSYPGASEPPYVNVTCQKQLSENVYIDERRPVLLCEGKLRLSALHDLFDLTTVEMLHGPLWIVLVADAAGFVPLTFRPRDELTVRNGRRKTTSLLTPGTPPALAPGTPPTTAPSPPALAPGTPPTTVLSPTALAPGTPPTTAPSPPALAPGTPPTTAPSPPALAPGTPPTTVLSPTALAPGTPPTTAPSPPALAPGTPPTTAPSPPALAPGTPPTTAPSPPAPAPGTPPTTAPSPPALAPGTPPTTAPSPPALAPGTPPTTAPSPHALAPGTPPTTAPSSPSPAPIPDLSSPSPSTTVAST
ncbi:hypothetical protein NHX12_034508 [Muraenolepis orangiensis]|uniref:WD repeat and coiled-coil-containing protein n=1 Tax=Muraenolepis orangiensis TaxID=630683 RepID=A0A9Q0I2Y4_9TELE|nr:hypothetical protein NHX12_034508 [Muraenolepis orangiensis]